MKFSAFSSEKNQTIRGQTHLPTLRSLPVALLRYSQQDAALGSSWGLQPIWHMLSSYYAHQTQPSSRTHLQRQTLSCKEILGWTRGTGEGALEHWLFITETHCFNISAPDLATPVLPSWRMVQAARTAIKN